MCHFFRNHFDDVYGKVVGTFQETLGKQLSKTLGRFRILDKAEQQKLRDANKVTKRDLREAGRGVYSKIGMAAPLQRSLTSLPTELLELVCSFLNARWALQPSC